MVYPLAKQVNFEHINSKFIDASMMLAKLPIKTL